MNIVTIFIYDTRQVENKLVVGLLQLSNFNKYCHFDLNFSQLLYHYVRLV